MDPTQLPPVSAEEMEQRRSTRAESTRRLVGMCEAFLRDSIPANNVILEQHFARYIPLFNEKAIEDMGEDHAKALATEYRGRFSLHHPIKIISTETTDDPNAEAVIYPEDGKRHIVTMMLPPLFKQVKTLNEIYVTDEDGNKIHQDKIPFLIDGLFNTSLRMDPISKGRHAEFVANVAEAIHIANPEEDRQKLISDFNDEQTRINAQTAARMAADGETPSEAADSTASSSIKTQEDDSPMSGLIDW